MVGQVVGLADAEGGVDGDVGFGVMGSSRARSSRPTSTAAASHPDELSHAQVGAAVTSFALLADPPRVRMLWALREAELDVASLG